MKLKQNFLFFISLSVHALFFLLAGIYYHHPAPIIILGDNKTNVVDTYVLAAMSPKRINQDNKHKENPIEKTPLQNQEKNVVAIAQKIPKKLHTKKTTVASNAKTSSQSQLKKQTFSSHSKGQSTEALLAMLHAAIQSQQQYPASALQLEREGRATVKFTLLTNGSIKDLNIIRSSGTASLDQAALRAVTHAAPFKQVEKYITKDQEFRIDVVFELA